MKINPIAIKANIQTRVNVGDTKPAKPHTKDTKPMTYENKAKKERKRCIKFSKYNICYKQGRVYPPPFD